MTRDQRKMIEWQLKNYPTRQPQVAECIAAACERGTVQYDREEVGRSSVRQHSDFTSKLDKIAERRDYRWCLVVENALNYFHDSPIIDVVRCRYFEYGWERLYVYRVCAEMHISKTALFKCIDDFLNTVHKYAINAGLMSVE